MFDKVVVAGQPDLPENTLVEFTLAAVNPYQRAKTTPMADAQERDVRLTGLYRTEGGQWPWDYEDVMLAPADGEQVLRDIGAIPVE